MTRMTGPDYAVMCNLRNIHTYIHTTQVPARASGNRSLSGPLPYASNLYAREPPKLLFALDGGGLEVAESARGVQQ